jgi:hypothetical protein
LQRRSGCDAKGHRFGTNMRRLLVAVRSTAHASEEAIRGCRQPPRAPQPNGRGGQPRPKDGAHHGDCTAGCMWERVRQRDSEERGLSRKIILSNPAASDLPAFFETFPRETFPRTRPIRICLLREGAPRAAAEGRNCRGPKKNCWIKRNHFWLIVRNKQKVVGKLKEN